MDVDLLIRKVFTSKPIWDRRLKDHAKKNVTDRCWRRIAKEMKFDEHSLRKKWKYLRDQFSIEVGKVIKATPGEEQSTVCPKWPYFKELLFLKDVVTPRPFSGNTKPKERMKKLYEKDESSNSDSEEVPDLSENEDNETSGPETKPQPEVIYHNQDPLETVETTPQLPQQDVAEYQPPLKRIRLQNNSNHKNITDAQPQKINVTRSNVVQDLENEDMLFFKSLLPHVVNIPANLKMRFRSRIQDVVDEFCYKNIRHELSSPGTSIVATDN